MDDRVTPAVLVLGLLVLLLALMYLGFRRRQKRQAGIPRPLAVPESPGARIVDFDDLLYVASTGRDQPLDRIAVSGLGFRGRASVAVFDRGIALGIAGEPDAFIPASDIDSVERATWTIDRVVERDGLVRLAWRLGGTPIDSYLRIGRSADQTALMTAVRGIMSAGAGARDGGS